MKTREPKTIRVGSNPAKVDLPFDEHAFDKHSTAEILEVIKRLTGNDISKLAAQTNDDPDSSFASDLLSSHPTGMERAHDLNAVAAGLGYSFDDARQLLEREAANTAREMTGRARVELRPVVEPAGPVVIEDETLMRLQRIYRERLASTELPPEGLASVEQAQAASRLVMTFQNLKKRLEGHGLEPPPKDSRVLEARRLAGAYYDANPVGVQSGRGRRPRADHAP